jgi:hypothetical protein
LRVGRGASGGCGGEVRTQPQRLSLEEGVPPEAGWTASDLRRARSIRGWMVDHDELEQARLRHGGNSTNKVRASIVEASV